MSDENEKPYWLKMFEKQVVERIDEDEAADSGMLKAVYMAMGEKLAKKRSEDRGGWHEPEICAIEDLKKMLVEHIDKGDWVDVLNFAGMLYVRTEMEKHD